MPDKEDNMELSDTSSQKLSFPCPSLETGFLKIFTLKEVLQNVCFQWNKTNIVDKRLYHIEKAMFLNIPMYVWTWPHSGEFNYCQLYLIKPHPCRPDLTPWVLKMLTNNTLWCEVLALRSKHKFLFNWSEWTLTLKLKKEVHLLLKIDNLNIRPKTKIWPKSLFTDDLHKTALTLILF